MAVLSVSARNARHARTAFYTLSIRIPPILIALIFAPSPTIHFSSYYFVSLAIRGVMFARSKAALNALSHIPQPFFISPRASSLTK